MNWVLTSGQESREEWLEMVFKYHGKHNSNNTKYQVWRQDNQPKILLHPRFIGQKLDYTHNNPVVAKIVERPEDYWYSSARNYLGIPYSVLDVEVIDFGVQEGYVLG